MTANGAGRHRRARSIIAGSQPPRRGAPPISKPADARGALDMRFRQAQGVKSRPTPRGLDGQLVPVDRRGPWRHRRAGDRIVTAGRRGPWRHRGAVAPGRSSPGPRRAQLVPVGVEGRGVTQGPVPGSIIAGRLDAGRLVTAAVEGRGVTVGPAPWSIIAGASTSPACPRRSSRAVASPKGGRRARSSPAASTRADSSPRPSRAVVSPTRAGNLVDRPDERPRREPDLTAGRRGLWASPRVPLVDIAGDLDVASSPRRSSRAVASPKGRARVDHRRPPRRGPTRHRGRRGPWGVTEGPATWSIGADHSRTSTRTGSSPRPSRAVASPKGRQPGQSRRHQDLDANRIVTAGRRGLWRHRRAVARIVTVGRRLAGSSPGPRRGPACPVDRRGPRREGDRGGARHRGRRGPWRHRSYSGRNDCQRAGRHRPGPGRSSPAASRLDAGAPLYRNPGTSRGFDHAVPPQAP